MHIILTNFVYSIQFKKRKNYVLLMTLIILGSLLKLLNVIRIDNSPENRSMNRM